MTEFKFPSPEGRESAGNLDGFARVFADYAEGLLEQGLAKEEGMIYGLIMAAQSSETEREEKAE